MTEDMPKTGEDHVPENVSEADILLPWYATGRLDEDERQNLTKMVESEPKLARQLREIEDDRRILTQIVESVPVGSDQMWAKLSDKIDRQSHEHVAQRQSRSGVQDLFRTFIDWIGNRPPSVVGAAVFALLCLVLLQAGVLATFVARNLPTYTTASSGTNLKSPLSDFDQRFAAVVQFSDEASVADINAFLHDNQLRIVDGPLEGFYTLSIDSDKVHADQVDAYISKLGQSSEIVAFIGRLSH